jgi:hypothetical protein
MTSTNNNIHFGLILVITVGIGIFAIMEMVTPHDYGPINIAAASTIEVPTYSDKRFPITGPNGTTIIDFENNTETVSFPFVNDTATVNIEEYQRCVDNEHNSYLQIQREMNVNTLDPVFIKDLEDHVKIAMQNCIYLNSDMPQELKIGR